MTEITQADRELLAAEYEKGDALAAEVAASIRAGHTNRWVERALRAIAVARRQRQGTVAIGIELAECAMQLLYGASNNRQNIYANTADEIRELIARETSDD